MIQCHAYYCLVLETIKIYYIYFKNILFYVFGLINNSREFLFHGEEIIKLIENIAISIH